MFDETLFRSQTGQRLHVLGCPHVDTALQPATTADVQALSVCTWCQAELDGHGRVSFNTLEEAMRALGCPEGTHRLIREALRSVDHNQIWVTNGQGYIALGLNGRVIAGINKTFVELKDSDTRIELPGFRASQGGGSPVDVRWGDVCERHFVARSVTGGCDLCDD